ncbi:MAG: hypothetical protein IT452_07590 [Planctomycetia bacterium]|nr:hypothetical protein [Planctomycetia bacterium]
MERINDREAVARLARAILGKGERTTNEDAVVELLFRMSERDEVAKKLQRGTAKQASRPAKTA